MSDKFYIIHEETQMARIKTVEKEEIIKDLQNVYDQFNNEFSDGATFNREYYRTYGHFTEKIILRYWPSWKEFVKEVVDKDDLKGKKKLAVLQEEISKLKNENRQLLLKNHSAETFFNEYKSKLTNVSFPKVIDAPKLSKVKQEKESILVLSDWHTGEIVKSEEVNNINDVTTEIILQRADDVFNRFTHLSNTINVRHARIYILGDMIAGDIHQELQRNQDENVIDSIITLNNYLTKKILETSSCFDTLKVIFIGGNHGRINTGNGKPFFKQKQILNFEYLMAMMVKENLKQYKKIECIVPRSPFYLDEVNTKNFLLMHGDSLAGGSNSFAGIPYYGLVQSAAKMYGALEQAGVNDTNFYHIIMGHLHAFSAIPIFNGGKLLINSSLIGTTEYGLNKMKSVGSIEQMMLVVAKDGDVESIIRLIPERKVKNG